jgi:DNA-binding MarR family transcriptional regulator
VEVALSRAWAECFPEGDLRLAEYRHIFQLLITQIKAAPHKCTMKNMCGIIASALQVDERTADTRIRRLVDDKLMTISVDERDKRKRLISATPAALSRFTTFDAKVAKILEEFGPPSRSLPESQDA